MNAIRKANEFSPIRINLHPLNFPMNIQEFATI